MTTSSIIENLLCDQDSLLAYSKGDIVDFKSIKRRLFLMSRDENRNIPDHYYKLNKEQSLKEITNLKGILTNGLYNIAKDYLELRGKKVYVRQGKQNEWQALLTKIPPLLLISTFLAFNVQIDVKSCAEIKQFYIEYIVPNARYTALPSSYLPQMETYVKDSNGFHDLHMHLNGTVETDVAWQDFLFAPEKIYDELEEVFDSVMVREQFEQEDGLRTPKDFLKLLKGARYIRNIFFWQIFPSANLSKDTFGSMEHMLHQINNSDTHDSVYTPFFSLVNISTQYNEDNSQLLGIEALMYVLIIKMIRENSNECLETIFHYYLLILGLTNRLLVQQEHQFGFAQFQKITVNDLRSSSEKTYRKRFFQLHGNEMRNIRFLEGRFAPKNTRHETDKLLNNITSGWKSLTDNIDKHQSGNNHPILSKLSLIAHFIKRTDTKPDDYVRHRELRKRLWNQAKVLSIMKQNNAQHIDKVVGIDAASSEFDAPPEVFAPIYRLLRRKGFNHFTYHAGEDFYHLLGGLRAIYEAVIFTGLSTGDRIGHATAAGVSPQVWVDNIGRKMLVRKGEYLDDLLFAYHLIIAEQIDALEPKLPFIINEIQELTTEIYRSSYSIGTIERAWLLRKYCPIVLSYMTLSDKESHDKFEGECRIESAETSSIFDYKEWCLVINKIKEQTNSPEDIALYKKYHNKFYKEAYEKIVEIDALKFFSVSDLEHFQLAVLKMLHDKEIVIETLPTSNVRIGHHHDFSTYHFGNWLKWEKEGYSIPPIVVGTDDTGIFATNIFNEFANIYEFLTHYHNYSHPNAMSVLKQLEENARVYKFT